MSTSPDTRPRWRRHARDIFGAVVSIAALAAVIVWALKQPAPKFPSQPGKIALLFVGVGVYAVATLLRGWRWDRVLTSVHVGHRKGDAYSLVCVGYMGNNVLPARGGELLRVMLMAPRAQARRRELLGSIIAERVLDVVALAGLFAVMTLASVAGSPVGKAPAYVALGGGVVGVIALLVYLRLRERGKFEKFATAIRPIARASRIVGRPEGAGLVAVTALVWVLEGIVFWLVGQSLGLHLDLVGGTFLVVLASFFALIPAAPGYVGTFDTAVLFGLHALKVTGGNAVAFAVLVRFVMFVPITLVGLVLLMTRHGGIRQLRKAARVAEADADADVEPPREPVPSQAVGPGGV
ncbi:MAG: glycosyltransferase 2 family protein [Thermoleophilaceae bacterium]|nr:glycosyltransferase 2 family protein [Thermoleophilaceae bacterium]